LDLVRVELLDQAVAAITPAHLCVAGNPADAAGGCAALVTAGAGYAGCSAVHAAGRLGNGPLAAQAVGWAAVAGLAGAACAVAAAQAEAAGLEVLPVLDVAGGEAGGLEEVLAFVDRLLRAGDDAADQFGPA